MADSHITNYNSHQSQWRREKEKERKKTCTESEERRKKTTPWFIFRKVCVNVVIHLMKHINFVGAAVTRDFVIVFPPHSSFRFRLLGILFYNKYFGTRRVFISFRYVCMRYLSHFFIRSLCQWQFYKSFCLMSFFCSSISACDAGVCLFFSLFVLFTLKDWAKHYKFSTVIHFNHMCLCSHGVNWAEKNIAKNVQ